MVTLAARLRAACVGHPVASIPWPHRLLHDAADEIERLNSALEQAQSCILGDTPEDIMIMISASDGGTVRFVRDATVEAVTTVAIT